jgi:hypothetical protein
VHAAVHAHRSWKGRKLKTSSSTSAGSDWILQACGAMLWLSHRHAAGLSESRSSWVMWYGCSSHEAPEQPPLRDEVRACMRCAAACFVACRGCRRWRDVHVYVIQAKTRVYFNVRFISLPSGSHMQVSREHTSIASQDVHPLLRTLQSISTLRL